MNSVVQQLQSKLQEKMDELGKEKADKDKFKRLYEQYQDQVVGLQAQLEDAGIEAKPVQRNGPSGAGELGPQKSASSNNRPKSAYRPGAQQNNQSSEQQKVNQSKQMAKSGIYDDDDEDEESNNSVKQVAATKPVAAAPK